MSSPSSSLPASRDVLPDLSAPAAPKRSSKPRHAKPSVVASAATPIVLGGALTAGFLVAGATAAQARATDAQLAALRQCESGGNYKINTGNGYYGAYQFSLPTWRSLGYKGMPHQASPATQDQAARDLQARSGWGQWPACSRKLGLRGGGGQKVSPPKQSAPSTSSTSSAPDRASRSAPRPAIPRPKYVVPKTAPVFATNLKFTQGAKYSEQVKAWQARMAQRGWRIAVDGLYGPQSTGVAKAFAKEKGLTVTPVGALDKRVFVGAWVLPVT